MRGRVLAKRILQEILEADHVQERGRDAAIDLGDQIDIAVGLDVVPPHRAEQARQGDAWSFFAATGAWHPEQRRAAGSAAWTRTAARLIVDPE
jgi:hypothetical protein